MSNKTLYPLLINRALALNHIVGLQSCIKCYSVNLTEPDLNTFVRQKSMEIFFRCGPFTTFCCFNRSHVVLISDIDMQNDLLTIESWGLRYKITISEFCRNYIKIYPPNHLGFYPFFIVHIGTMQENSYEEHINYQLINYNNSYII